MKPKCPKCESLMKHQRSDRMVQGKSNKYICPECGAHVRIIIPLTTTNSYGELRLVDEK
jgi:DNA-directed RNA polymerase subunit M/transcription elongation factor TFIIS